MTPCADQELLLQALLDGELDAANSVAVESHLAGCLACTAYVAEMRALRGRLAAPELRPHAPDRLHKAVAAMITTESRAAPRNPRPWPLFAAGWSAAGALAAVAATLVIAPLQPQPNELGDQLVANHVRSLLAGHLIDVATSDRHVVKPWFNGKIDFAPPVPDLSAGGFPLVGGRLDYADGRVVAAIVYRRRAHTINLFVLPTGSNPPVSPHASAARPGYSMERWTRNGLDFWAVSDLDPKELETFHVQFVDGSTS